MIEIDFNDLASFARGKKRLMGFLEGARESVSSAVSKIRSGGEGLGWVRLPDNEGAAVEVKEYASSLQAGIQDAVVMGIGGSSLGAKAIYSAACHPMQLMEGWRPPGGRKLYFLDNSDPDTVAAVLENVDPARTLFVVITKSGATAETAAQMMVAWKMAEEKLGDGARDHFVFVTDPEMGDLRALSREMGVKSFPIPPDVGGRFSVLSCVGLLPAALAGIDPAELLRGARAAMERCLVEDIFENPAALLGACAHLLDVEFGKSVHVLFSYSDALADTGAWFRQLWGESLGKRRGRRRVGPTPLDARGATDQHSLLQLLKEGPGDKFVIFLDVKRRRRLVLPRVFERYGSFSYLGGRGMNDLISSEIRGTRMSLARGSVPTLGIDIEDTGPACVASLMYLLETATAVAGFLYGINPFDQPGVEESKRFAQALMGKPGSEQYRFQLERAAGDRDPNWVVKI